MKQISPDTNQYAPRGLTKARVAGLTIAVTILVAWVLHTLSRIGIVGIENTVFMEEKLKEGFVQPVWWKPVLIIHAVAASVALLSGAAALALASTRRFTGHRLAGRIYVISLFISAKTAIPLVFFATGGLASTIGFWILNAAWLSTTYAAYKYAKRRVIHKHMRWAARSLSLSMANTTITVATALMIATDLVGDHTKAYTISTWLSIPFNLICCEILLRAFSGKPNQYNKQQA